MTRKGREEEAEAPTESRLWHILEMFPSPAQKDKARQDPPGRADERKKLLN